MEDNVENALRNAALARTVDRSSNILNIACEFQLIPPFLRDRVDGANVFGLELNREIVAQVPNVRYCDVDKNLFPFEDGTFDLIVSIFGVEHFKTANVFTEAHRTLKKGGRFLFIVPNTLYPAFFLNRFLGQGFASFFYKRVMRSAYHPHKAYYRFNRLGTIRRAAKRAGFTNNDLTFIGPANILLYFQRFTFLKMLATVFDRLLNNPLLFRFKPYIVVTLEKIMTKTELIHRITSLIPRGKVSTYGDLARLAGLRSARVVGNALHRNKNWRAVPCHRVVNAAGRLAPAFGMGGARIHQMRLVREGIRLLRRGAGKQPGIVDLARHRWRVTASQLQKITHWTKTIDASYSKWYKRRAPFSRR